MATHGRVRCLLLTASRLAGTLDLPPARMRGQYQFTATLYRLGILYCIDVPGELSRALGAAPYIPVAGTLNAIPLRGLLVPRGGGCHRLFLDANIRRASGAVTEARVECSLGLDRKSREIPIPADLREAFADEPGTRHSFDGLTPAQRREILLWIDKARRDETRAKRIARLVDRLRDRPKRDKGKPRPSASAT